MFLNSFYTFSLISVLVGLATLYFFMIPNDKMNKSGTQSVYSIDQIDSQTGVGSGTFSHCQDFPCVKAFPFLEWPYYKTKSV